jgi:hypothetical protein
MTSVTSAAACRQASSRSVLLLRACLGTKHGTSRAAMLSQCSTASAVQYTAQLGCDKLHVGGWWALWKFAAGAVHVCHLHDQSCSVGAQQQLQCYLQVSHVHGGNRRIALGKMNTNTIIHAGNVCESLHISDQSLRAFLCHHHSAFCPLLLASLEPDLLGLQKPLSASCRAGGLIMRFLLMSQRSSNIW